MTLFKNYFFMSIAANDLRIGNWVNIRLIGLETEGTPTQINVHHLLDIGGSSGAFLNKKCYEAIPLTPEVLLSCGFELSDDFLWYIKEGCSIQVFNDMEQLCYCDFMIDTRIKSLHELQNIIHALTGIELNYNTK
jgi:hypothetical protein